MINALIWSHLALAETPSQDQPNQELQERVKQIYTYRCEICHGESGKGDGATAQAMEPKPTDFSQPEYWSNRTDAFVLQQIRYGSPEVFMPAFPKIPDAQLNALLSVLKSFQTQEEVVEPPVETEKPK